MESALKNLPEEFKDDIEKAIHILKDYGCTDIYLFGSIAEGNVHEGSDIDLAVRGCHPEKFFSIYGRLMMELNHQVDLVRIDRGDDFTRYLEESGKLLPVYSTES